MTQIKLLSLAPLAQPDCFTAAQEMLWEERRREIRQIKSDLARRQRTGAGALLTHTLRQWGISSFSYAVHPSGKPFLQDHPEVFFSLSHSGEWALCAVSDRPIGADLQSLTHYRPAVAERMFPPEEAARLAALPRAKQDRAFTAAWAAAESRVKYTGSWQTYLTAPIPRPVIAPIPAVIMISSPEAALPRAELWEIEGSSPCPGL